MQYGSGNFQHFYKIKIFCGSKCYITGTYHDKTVDLELCNIPGDNAAKRVHLLFNINRQNFLWLSKCYGLVMKTDKGLRYMGRELKKKTAETE